MIHKGGLHVVGKCSFSVHSPGVGYDDIWSVLFFLVLGSLATRQRAQTGSETEGRWVTAAHAPQCLGTVASILAFSLL